MKKSGQYINYDKISMAVTVIVLILASFLSVSCAQGIENRSQLTIGLVTNNPNGLKNVQGFKDGMAELGYVEGENVTYLFKGKPLQGDDLQAELKHMVESRVNLIFTAGTPTGVAAHQITQETGIPVVFGVIADPIAAGVIEDLIRPGGNMTGVMLSQNQARRLELLLEIVPDVKRIFVPYNPDDAAPASAVSQLHEVADDFNVEILEGHARDSDEVTTLLNTIPPTIDAIFLLPDSMINPRLDDILAIAVDRRLPVSGPSIAQVEGGALTAYGIVHHQVGAHAARIAHQILKGVDPGQVPVETAEFFLAINLQAAEAIGLEIPYEVLQKAEIIIRADEQK